MIVINIPPLLFFFQKISTVKKLEQLNRMDNL